MSPRNTALLFVAAVLLGAFIYLYDDETDEPAEGAAARSNLLFAGVDADRIDRLRLRTRDGQDVEVERDGDGWSIVRPLRVEADDVALESIVSQLAQIEIAGRVESDAPASQFGLDDESLLVEFELDGAWQGMRAGNPTPVGSNTYVSREDTDEIVYVATWRIRVYSKTLAELRNRQIMDFDQTAVVRIDVSWPGSNVELERRDGEWWMTSPVNERADEGTVETLLSDLAFLRADDFLDASSASNADLGLDPPVLRVVLHGEPENGPPWSRGLTLGDVHEGRRVARGEGGALFVVAPERLDDYPRELIAWRWKELSRFVVADARAFELTFRPADGPPDGVHVVKGTLRAGEWEVGPEPMDPRRARALVRTLSALEAEEIVAEDMGVLEREAVGLAPARLSVSIRGEGGTPLAEVDFGLRAEGRGPLARRRDRTVVYRVAREDADALPADWADFEASFLAQPTAEGEAPFGEDAEAMPDDGLELEPGVELDPDASPLP